MRIEELSTRFVHVIPKAMRSYRTEISGLAGPELTVLKFRVLVNISRRTTVTNQDLSENIGILPSAMSRLVDDLVSSGYVARKTSVGDRRRIDIRLTPRGVARIDALRKATGARFVERFRTLSPKKRAELAKGLAVLEEVFETP